MLPLVAASFSWTSTDPLIVGWRVQMDGTTGQWVYLPRGGETYRAHGKALVLQYSHDGESYSPSVVFSAKPGRYTAGSLEMVVEETPEKERKGEGVSLSFIGGANHTITTEVRALCGERNLWEMGLEAQWKDLWRNAGVILGGSYTPFTVDGEVFSSYGVDAILSFSFPSEHYALCAGLGGFWWFLDADDVPRTLYGIEGVLRYTFMIDSHWFAGFGVRYRYYLRSRFYHLEEGTLFGEKPSGNDGGAMAFGAHAIMGFAF